MMARPSTARRGQPLWAIGGIVLGWVALRAALFEVPAMRPELALPLPRDIVRLVKTSAASSAMAQGVADGPAMQPQLLRPLAYAGPPRFAIQSLPLARPMMPPPSGSAANQGAVGHNLLWMAAMSAVPILPEVAAALSNGQPDAARPEAGRQPASRWSGDAWLAWRPGSGGLATGAAAAPVYGGSQAGAVLRYELAPGSRHRPAAYVRAVHALTGAREGDLAAGVALRPLAGLAVTAHGEARLSRREGGTELRPAAFVSAGVDALPVAGGAIARGYAQAGYVGGRDATAFADGSVIVEKPLWRDRDSALTAGAGTWGGAQRGAARLDIGPTASLRFRLGQGAARLSADYRLRIAGQAEPAAGAALTLSAGF
jgi:hypothetical protein